VPAAGRHRGLRQHGVGARARVSPTSPFGFLYVGGSGTTVTPQPVDDSGLALTISTVCGASPGATAGLQLFDNLEHPSNTLCLHPAP
jgi:hypothetical protein